MTCAEWRNRTQEWIEAHGFHVEELPEELSAHISECSACALSLQAMKRLFGGDARRGDASHGGVPREEPPADLSARVMDRIRAEAETDEGESRTVRSREARDRARFSFGVLPKVAAALLLVALTATVTFFVARGPGADSGSNLVTVRLELRAPDANEVSVVGDWNNWNPEANPMTDQNGDGIWETTIKVEPTQDYMYQFLINGERWIPDPNSQIKVEDGFGGTNSVLNI